MVLEPANVSQVNTNPAKLSRVVLGFGAGQVNTNPANLSLVVLDLELAK